MYSTIGKLMIEKPRGVLQVTYQSPKFNAEFIDIADDVATVVYRGTGHTPQTAILDLETSYRAITETHFKVTS